MLKNSKDNNITKKRKKTWVDQLLKWYKINKRNLPWRKKNNQNFYSIWISEIMLQQTQVKTVIPYFERFKEKWPYLKKFKSATLNDILLIWKGLGYYQRAHNIYKTLQILKKKQINPLYVNLIKLPGIGEYTAASISAILKNDGMAVVDGNIKRILSRVCNIKENEKNFLRKIKNHAQCLTPNDNRSDYCQSLMDLGATICLPRNPKCQTCPVDSFCDFNLKKRKPVKKLKKTKSLKFGIAFIVKYKKKFFIVKSKEKLLENMFGFPTSDFFLISTINNFNLFKKETIKSWIKTNSLSSSYEEVFTLKHNFSGFDLKLLIVKIESNKDKIITNPGLWIEKDKFKEFPFSKLMSKITNEVIY